MQNYFNQQIWYTASVDADKFDESRLSGIEKANIDFLAEAERKIE
ncbi:MAG: YARHG domain-containing protein [Clostridiales bacterium]|nr:YARHG domain-containing protein [Clostridiales bacterium]